MSKFDNDKATDDERAAYLESKNAELENQGADEEDDASWVLFYKGVDGRDMTQYLDAQSYDDALFEACNII